MINKLISERNLSLYKISKLSGIPYTTVNDICRGRTRLEKCSAETVYKLAKVLAVTMEELLEPYVRPRCSFELFKSNVCHHLKEIGDTDFIIETLENDEIRMYFRLSWYRECFYLLGMLDYVSNENDVPICCLYDDIRSCRLEEPLYPSGVLAMCRASGSEDAKKQAQNEAIPEFMHFNIVESDVRNVV